MNSLKLHLNSKNKIGLYEQLKQSEYFFMWFPLTCNRMSSVSEADYRCQHGDTICGEFSCLFVFNFPKKDVVLLIVSRRRWQTSADWLHARRVSEDCACCRRLPEIRVYEQEVIIVPTLLLASFLVTIVFIFLLRFCPERVDRIRPQASKVTTRRILQGIDGKLTIKKLSECVSN